MLNFYQKRKLRSILNSRITRAVLAVLAGLMLWNAYERYVIADMMSDRRVLIEQEAALLQSQKAELEAQVQYLRDDRGIEAAMRRQFDIALPGEDVVVILEDEDSESEIQPLQAQVESTSWWPW